jgi:hypothetical protein
MFPLTPRLRAVLEAQLAHTHAVELATGRVVPWLFHRDGKPIKSFRRAWATCPGQKPHLARVGRKLPDVPMNRDGKLSAALTSPVGERA